MTFIKFNILFLSVFLLLLTSCKSNDSRGIYEEWKSKNDLFFTNMKDSTGYTLYNIPLTKGGSSYYYKIKSPGIQSSVSPLYTDFVEVQYRGKTITGIVFDQTYTGAVAPTDSTATIGEFYVNQLVRGWSDNLIHMKTGELRTIVLPQDLGYGDTGAGNMIPPFSATIWEVRLVKVIHKN